MKILLLVLALLLSVGCIGSVDMSGVHTTLDALEVAMENKDLHAMNLLYTDQMTLYYDGVTTGMVMGKSHFIDANLAGVHTVTINSYEIRNRKLSASGNKVSVEAQIRVDVGYIHTKVIFMELTQVGDKWLISASNGLF